MNDKASNHIAGMEMITFIRDLLESNGQNTAQYENDDEIDLCWFDIDKARNSLTVWLDDGECLWHVVKNGKTVTCNEFNISDEVKPVVIRLRGKK